MRNIEWQPKQKIKFNGKVKDYISKVRNIPDIELFLNPTSKVVHDPMLMLNMKEAVERTRKAIHSNEEITVTVDPDTDGCTSAVIMYDYLKRRLGARVNIAYHERDDGHGVQNDDVPKSTDLLIILDSSSNEVKECERLSDNMDIIILDHHVVEKDNPYCILVNIQQTQCNYPNKNLCTGLMALKFTEVLDYHFQKLDTHHYSDLAAVALLADSMDMSEMENRFFVKEGINNIRNVGLLALIQANNKTPNKVNSTFLNYQIIPVINTTTRNSEIHKALKILLQPDFKKAKKMAKVLLEDNKKRKEKVEELMEKYEQIMDNGKIIFAVADFSTKSYNGLVAQKLASKYKKPAVVLADNGELYEGSFRSYNGFDLLTFFKNCPYVKMAAGHKMAAGISIPSKYFDKLKPYVEDGLSEISFDPVIKYDIEIDEDDLGDVFEEDKPNMELVEEIESINYVSGKGSEPLTVRINNIAFRERELFGKEKNHTSINAKHFDMKKFNDDEFGNELDNLDILDAIGSLNINEYGGKKRIQLMIEDYKIN